MTSFHYWKMSFFVEYIEKRLEKLINFRRSRHVISVNGKH
nr:MAG TPA: hypothetical protein [Caudoviricetes sp.]